MCVPLLRSVLCSPQAVKPAWELVVLVVRSCEWHILVCGFFADNATVLEDTFLLFPLQVAVGSGAAEREFTKKRALAPAPSSSLLLGWGTSRSEIAEVFTLPSLCRSIRQQPQLVLLSIDKLENIEMLDSLLCMLDIC